MLKPQGYAVILSPDAPLVEVDTITCFHCQQVVPVPARANAADCGGFCRRCMELVCGPCADAGTCTPWEKQLELAEKQAESRRRMDAAMASMAAV